MASILKLNCNLRHSPCNQEIWWAVQDLNLRPLACHRIKTRFSDSFHIRLPRLIERRKSEVGQRSLSLRKIAD